MKQATEQNGKSWAGFDAVQMCQSSHPSQCEQYIFVAVCCKIPGARNVFLFTCPFSSYAFQSHVRRDWSLSLPAGDRMKETPIFYLDRRLFLLAIITLYSQKYCWALLYFTTTVSNSTRNRSRSDDLTARNSGVARLSKPVSTNLDLCSVGDLRLKTSLHPLFNQLQHSFNINDRWKLMFSIHYSKLVRDIGLF